MWAMLGASTCHKAGPRNYSACTTADFRCLEKVVIVDALTVNGGVFGLDLQGNKQRNKKISNREEGFVSLKNGTWKWPEKSQTQLAGIR